MVSQKKIVKTETDLANIESGQVLKSSLDKMMLEQKRVHRMIDLFILALFLVYVMYII